MPHVNQFSSFQYAGEDELFEQEDEDFTYDLYPTFQEDFETDPAEDPSIEVVPVVINTTPVPLFLTGKHRANTTGPRAAGSGPVMPDLSARRPGAAAWQFEFHDVPGTETSTEPLVSTTWQFQASSGALPDLPEDSPVTSTGQFKVISGVLPALSRPQPETRAGQQERNTSALPGNTAAGQPGATTGQLGAPPAQLPIFITTPSLAPSLQAALTSGTTGRIVVIPGSRKRKQAEMGETPLDERVSPRLRQGMILAALLAMVIASLFTLGPLASGQYPFPIFRSFSSWFRSNTANQQLSSHSKAELINTNNLPPMQFPQSPYVGIAQQDAIAAGIPAVYFVRQMNQESGFNPNAVSPAGAEGIAQFMPGTAAGLGINPWDPVQALRAAANLMGSYTRSYGGNYAMSLAAYNGGTGAVQHATYICGSSWMNCLPYETRNYIYVIMGI